MLGRPTGGLGLPAST
ncbi:hypothetical protein V501_00158, partial [Pseudogymnoascus sp. VKM F-4519 (FW-2642)]